MDYPLATCETSPNNALIKYWGKRDEKLFLPTNGSVSVAMDESLTTRTTVVFSKEFEHDEMWIDEKKLEGRELSEVTRVLDLVRAKGKTTLHAKAASVNTFPAAAGLASSASGLAALAVASTNALGLELSARELSILARQGSGSACRSVLGGFVEWKRGVQKNGADSFAVQVAPPEHWPEFRCIIGIVTRERKKISSREGMRQTIATSSLFQERLRGMEAKIADCKKFILEKDAPMLWETVMRDAMNMHACMLDTYPPIIYLNDASKRIVNAVHEYNESRGAVLSAYSFDAGPNAHVYCLSSELSQVKRMLESVEGVEQTIVSRVGPGPRLIEDQTMHLLDGEGNPTAAFDAQVRKTVRA